MLAPLHNFLRRFRRDDQGSIAVEAILVFPVLFWAVLATFVYFDAFRSQSNNLKAAFTISDALSRESGYVTPEYLTSLHRLQEALTSSNHDSRIRVTVIRYDEGADAYNVVWSQQQGGANPLTTATLLSMRDRLPVMPDNEILILYENWIAYEPIFSIGLDAFTFQNMVFTRPRFTPDQLCWNSVNDGDYTTATC
ncbi:pilus assembly protein [Loktanella sp. IMCC34160]|uniref:TadE/TadG family type IV pilus assembly protein n=1 Tax=Loktanella sp. IMCC34160 TaxID=2510646 RepID=UPI00101D7990|nr:TadE/TadG family type IV pilus assembly protein [Loktanella sp. IMCC34160]RYG93165.1 pilus assembly protein [Loktanella sp. IMCC34160]